ncbi:hypothetical protein KEJ36_00350 [Candidatus Bathyarchaeota archaeon]|nr:hypothetical protein [Candidatus Bathyarchaeota archaeon]MBS7627273.1 hypothetical protein [Candidatus Bathyarchaeota archaeon]
MALEYFRRRGFKCQAPAILNGISGRSYRFDILLKGKAREKRVVWVKDWNRYVGINVIIALDVASEDVGIPNPIMVGRGFSDNVRTYSQRRGISLITDREILSSLMGTSL